MDEGTGRKSNERSAAREPGGTPAFLTPFADDRIAWSSNPHNGLVTAVVVGPDTQQRLRVHVRRYKLVSETMLVPLPGGGASLSVTGFSQAVERVREALLCWGVSS